MQLHHKEGHIYIFAPNSSILLMRILSIHPGSLLHAIYISCANHVDTIHFHSDLSVDFLKLVNFITKSVVTCVDTSHSYKYRKDYFILNKCQITVHPYNHGLSLYNKGQKMCVLCNMMSTAFCGLLAKGLPFEISRLTWVCCREIGILPNRTESLKWLKKKHVIF